MVHSCVGGSRQSRAALLKHEQFRSLHLLISLLPPHLRLAALLVQAVYVVGHARLLCTVVQTQAELLAVAFGTGLQAEW